MRCCCGHIQHEHCEVGVSSVYLVTAWGSILLCSENTVSTPANRRGKWSSWFVDSVLFVASGFGFGPCRANLLRPSHFNQFCVSLDCNAGPCLRLRLHGRRLGTGRGIAHWLRGRCCFVG